MLFRDAETATGEVAVAPVAVTVTEAIVAPANTVIEPGTGRTLELLKRLTFAPPAGAGELNVALNVTDCPL